MRPVLEESKPRPFVYNQSIATDQLPMDWLGAARKFCSFGSILI